MGILTVERFGVNSIKFVSLFTVKRVLQNQVKWLYSKFAEGKGGILGDDMGLGKTVQAVTLISAMLQKTGERVICSELSKQEGYCKNIIQ